MRLTGLTRIELTRVMRKNEKEPELFKKEKGLVLIRVEIDLKDNRRVITEIWLPYKKYLKTILLDKI